MSDLKEKKLLWEGIKLLLNDKFDEARELFSWKDKDIQMTDGYCFLSFINIVLYFKAGTLKESLHTLKEITRCSQEFGWLKSIKNRALSTFNYSDEILTENLEKQILLADSHLCVAVLTLLQQNFTSYVKGVWVLLKAWKVYEDSYFQISKLYKKAFGCNAFIAGCQKAIAEFLKKSVSSVNIKASSSYAKEILFLLMLLITVSLSGPGGIPVAADGDNNKFDVNPDTVPD